LLHVIFHSLTLIL